MTLGVLVPHSDPYVPIEDTHFDVTAATVLDGGGYVRVWYGSGSSGLQLYGQVFDASLQVYKDKFAIGPDGGTLDLEPDVLALSDGGFFVTWTLDGILYGARYDNLGDAQTDAVRISDRGSNASVAELENGNLAVIWQQTEKGWPYTDVVGAIIDTDGNRIQTISNITGETVDWQNDPSVAALKNGGFVVTWEIDVNTDSLVEIDRDVQFRIFSANGTAVTSVKTVSPETDGSQYTPDVATLDDGNFVIVWGSERGANASLENIYGRIFTPSGSAVTDRFEVDSFPTSSADQVFPSVAATQDGGFYVAWGSHTSQLYGQRFDEDGKMVGNYTVLDQTSSEQHYNADVNVSGDGRVFISWQYYTQDNSSFGMNASVQTLGAVTPSLDGTNGNNNISGTSSADEINGLGGNDTLKGLGGADTIYGGTGNDIITMGNGNDLAAGGSGNDEVFAGGNGSDIIRGDAGDDVLGGGDGIDIIFGGGTDAFFSTDTGGQDGRDTLFGGAGDDLLVGGDWIDADNDSFPDAEELLSPSTDDPNVIWAGSGNDILFGALGSDTLGGGEGNDLITGLAGNDLIYGGKGDDANSNDTVFGGSGNDRIYAGTGADDLSGEGGNDVIYGGSANDTIYGDEGADTLWGGAHDDILYGGADNDTLNGGTGNDTLSGDDGEDRFTFGANHGDDTVEDFDLLEDSLALGGLGFSSLSDLSSVASNATVNGETGLLLETGASSSIFLVGLDISSVASMTVTF